ncbi:MAG TPA: hypothetical protein VGJ94_01345 [Syntrophorhabdaceae bacterium]
MKRTTSSCRYAADGPADLRHPEFTPRHPISIDRKQLPAPPQKFEGKIKRTTKGSRPYWLARIVLSRVCLTCC